MVTEFTGMAEDFPEMFASGGTLQTLGEAGPVNKILERLLAGLIPIRAVAIDYSVITVEGTRYLAHNDLLTGLDVEVEPLQIVGLTEHLAYWKDLRRVLFSDAEFTILGRISRSGIQRVWTPVKLADMFQDLVPDLARQINAAGRVPLAGGAATEAENPNRVALDQALALYAASYAATVNKRLKKADREAVASEIANLRDRFASVSSQRSAFGVLGLLLREVTGEAVDADRDLELREEARLSSGLSLFPLLSQSQTVAPSAAPTVPEPEENLVDVEVVAIYW
ncbi:hypothetical protein PlfCFBP13513_03385 [Plantibacter flavus]|nr:hypothetical protein PlfCFBP13513_03385 [Plantibacter flavus]